MGTEYAMLLCLAYGVQSRTLALGCCDDCGNSSRENQNIYVKLVVHSLDFSRCVGDIGKPSVNTMKTRVCGIGERNVF